MLIENLSNEIFYEIFDYLDGCDINETFSNLNHRFEQILNSSLFLFKIKFDSKSNKLYENFYKQITHINKHQIRSLNLDLSLKNGQDFFSLFLINSSFEQLKSLTLKQLEQDLLVTVLSNLSNLPRLSSLTIATLNVLKHSTDIYRIVFNLKALTYFNFKASNTNLHIVLPISTKEQYTSIKYLIINHCCTFSELASIVSYTPQLCYLDYLNMNFNRLNNEIILPITLTNLTQLFLFMFEIKYEEFETFISNLNMNMKLKIFSLITLSEDILYFDAIQLQQIITKYFHELKGFYFEYHESINYEYQSSAYLGEPNQFISSFWIKRQWGFEVKIQREYIVYTVCPYEKRWYEYYTEFTTQFSKSARLILTDIPSLEYQYFIIDYINRALTVAQYYHLEIPNEEIFHGTLIQIVDLLSELTTLRIHSISFEESRNLCEEEVDILLSREDTNKITKVYLGIMMEITDIYFLMVLCPQMEYLKIFFINDMNIELFVQEILNKINYEKNKYLRLLCFRVEAADDELIKRLEKIINTEKLLIDYSIKRMLDNIYLKWK